MPPHCTLLDNDEDLPMVGALTGAAVQAHIALNFGASPEMFLWQLVQQLCALGHFLNEQHVPYIQYLL
jgi:hypothetical protein